MNRRLELLGVVLFALGAALVGGITSSLADEITRVEVGVGELRGEICRCERLRVPLRWKRTQITRAMRRPRLRLLARRPARTGQATTKRLPRSASPTSARSTPRMSGS